MREALIAAGAGVNHIPVTEYTGLVSGSSYYALDRSTGTYWAGAALQPAPSNDPDSPTRAQVASQDAGSYYLFTRSTGGSWKAFPDGNTGPDTPCPIKVPATVDAAWGWAAGSCRPASD
ncbi:MAG: hypothetical protein ACRDVW_03285 [Acidimicrobiales bacterium]